MRLFLRNFTVYPNPARGMLNLSFEMTNSGTSSIGLFDLQGREIHVFEEHIHFHEGSHHIELTLPGNIEAGLYIFQFRVGVEAVFEKVMIE